MKSIRIINQKLIADIKKYATAHGIKSEAEYQKRNPNDTAETIAADAVIGKVAEFAVAAYFGRKDFTVSAPDTEIYPSNLVKHDPDVKVHVNGNVHKIHVKSCRYNSFGNYSWLYQKTANYLSKDTHAFCVVRIDADGYTVLFKIVKGKDLEGKYKPTFAHQPSKCAIYVGDI